MTLQYGQQDPEDGPLVMEPVPMPTLWQEAGIRRLDLAGAMSIAAQADRLADSFEVIEAEALRYGHAPAQKVFSAPSGDLPSTILDLRDAVERDAMHFAGSAVLDLGSDVVSELAWRIEDLREAAADAMSLLDRSRQDAMDEVRALAEDEPVPFSWMRSRDGDSGARATDDFEQEVKDRLIEPFRQPQKIAVGSIIRIRFVPGENRDSYSDEQVHEIVDGPSEADTDRLGSTSPLGAQLLDWQSGDTVDVTIGGKAEKVLILEVVN